MITIDIPQVAAIALLVLSIGGLIVSMADNADDIGFQVVRFLLVVAVVLRVFGWA